jgi:hypothetical protein
MKSMEKSMEMAASEEDGWRNHWKRVVRWSRDSRSAHEGIRKSAKRCQALDVVVPDGWKDYQTKEGIRLNLEWIHAVQAAGRVKHRL